MVEHLLRERISLRGICRAVGVSLTWLLHFMVECFAACPDDLYVRVPLRPTDVVLRRLEAEADEMWSFVQQKANKQWIWIAMDTATRQIIAFMSATGVVRVPQHCGPRFRWFTGNRPHFIRINMTPTQV
jgi:insertion element IS1 protein InsB